MNETDPTRLGPADTGNRIFLKKLLAHVNDGLYAVAFTSHDPAEVEFLENPVSLPFVKRKWGKIERGT